VKTRAEEIEAARPKDLHFRCDDSFCCAKQIWVDACQWADANPAIRGALTDSVCDHGALVNELERANKRIAALSEALEFYANGPCMTYPTIKPPRDMPLRDIPKFIVESTVSVVRDVARKALEDK